MPPVATCGRFDNAPAHVIINSARCRPMHQRESEAALTDEEIEAREEIRAKDRDRKLAARQKASSAKAEERESRRAIERAAKEARSRLEKEKNLERNNARDAAKKIEAARAAIKRIKARKSTEEYKARQAAQARERWAKRRRIMYPIPDGYVALAIAEKGSGMTASGFNYAVKSGIVPGKKIGRNWYVEEAAAREYAASKYERKCALLRAVSPKGKQCHTTR